MENKKVKVVSMVAHRVGLDVPEYNIKRVFTAQGQSFLFGKELFNQIIYSEGVRALFEAGTLYIEDMEVKKELGLEPQDATEPQNIIVLSDIQRKTYMTSMKIEDFKKKVKVLPEEQLNALIDFAIEKDLVKDLTKAEILSELSGRNVLKAVELKIQAKEA